ncbi:MAG: NUDIX domain-containing protein [Chitinophagaceae bacterium]|nr:MAG: NUDIX domain-containing protein [Chitinophagaceae bacterium]
MYIKIFFDDKPLFLCDKIDAEIEPYVHHDDAVMIDELNSHTVKSMIHEMQQEKIHAGVFVHHDLDELRKAVFKKFTVIPAGGGLVRNPVNEYLLIHRRGKWDLPKGKLDEGETIEECAIREVEEETGIKNIKLGAPLLVTYHTYKQGTHLMLKESHWYHMSVSEQQELVPQTEEDITEARWVPADQAGNYVAISFPSVGDVLKKGISGLLA